MSCNPKGGLARPLAESAWLRLGNPVLFHYSSFREFVLPTRCNQRRICDLRRAGGGGDLRQRDRLRYRHLVVVPAGRRVLPGTPLSTTAALTGSRRLRRVTGRSPDGDFATAWPDARSILSQSGRAPADSRLPAHTPSGDQEVVSESVDDQDRQPPRRRRAAPLISALPSLSDKVHYDILLGIGRSRTSDPPGGLCRT